MKLVILAAGQGTRLRPFTDQVPKCMVRLEGKPLLQYQLESARAVGIEDIHVVTGYRADVVRFPNITKHINSRFDSTNMVTSLFCAESIMDGDLIISYGDIVYQSSLLQTLIDADIRLGVVIDVAWRHYWEARMDDPLKDAETLKLRKDGTIYELGKKPRSYEDIQGQYIGMVKFSAAASKEIRRFYHRLDRSQTYDGKDFDNMYMTSFIQLIADQLMPVSAVPVRNGWMEIDEPADLELTQFLRSNSESSDLENSPTPQ